MQTFTRIRNLNFSGKYPLAFTEQELQDVRMMTIDVSVARQALSPYFSSRTNPPNGFQGTFTQIWQDFVIRRHDVDFTRQRFVIADESDRQLIPAMKCIHELDVINLSLLATQLGQPNLIFLAQYVKDLSVMPFVLDELLFQCYADVALNVQVNVLKYEVCNFGNGENPTPPVPPVPLPVPIVEPGQPFPPALFAPEPPNSGGNYLPFPGDMSAPVDPSPLCGNYAVTYTIFNPTSPASVPFTQTITLPGNAYDTFIVEAVGGGSFNAGLVHSAPIMGDCTNDQETIVFSGGVAGLTITLDSSVEI
jgi:hypothetical protein